MPWNGKACLNRLQFGIQLREAGRPKLVSADSNRPKPDGRNRQEPARSSQSIMRYSDFLQLFIEPLAAATNNP